jgi:tetrapyrrole methylase family protein / MazG family protein
LAMKEFNELNKTIETLRSPRGCPWDREQTVETMKQYLLEEAYELADAVAAGNIKEIKEELGDLFLILIVISQMHQEKKLFSLAEVLDSANHKLISRHPHVFSTEKLKTKKDVLDHWIKSKAKKKKRKTIKCRLPLSAPALTLAAIFNKELEHVQPRRSGRGGDQDIIEAVIATAGELKKPGARKTALASMAFDLCRLAFVEAIDLESLLREKVLKSAELVPYESDKK